ncbi:MAG: recombinase RecA [Armatimonadetes bacterium]|nr:recombinase RecA [Armatimonadota bacterium]MCX7776483.1 recombinase RecA [Armatimonadota bacterium]
MTQTESTTRAQVNGEKLEALESTISRIEKRFGKGSIMRLSDQPTKMRVDVIPTGSIALDIATGIGGIPRGRITEIFGPEGSGKTTLAYHIIAEAQKMGGIAAFIDAEHAMDRNYVVALGIDLDRLYISQPDSGEQALEIADELVRSGAIDVLVIDSVAALVPRAELEGEMGDQHMGLQARLMSQALRKLAGSINRSRTAAVLTNQVREKIGIMFGSPEVTPGGRALKFWASLRLRISKEDSIRSGNEIVGHICTVKVVKNKLAPPFRDAGFEILFGKGICRYSNILDVATQLEIVTKVGTWYSYNEERLGQGRENAWRYLEQHPELAAEIELQIRRKRGLPIPPWLEELASGRKEAAPVTGAAEG